MLSTGTRRDHARTDQVAIETREPALMRTGFRCQKGGLSAAEGAIQKWITSATHPAQIGEDGRNPQKAGRTSFAQSL